MVPKVNNSLWKKLNEEQRKQELSAQYTQRALVKTATAVARAVDEIEASRPSVVSNLTDAIAMIGHAFREISFIRRKLM